MDGEERVESRVVPKNNLREHQAVRIRVNAVEEGMAVFHGPGCRYSVGCGVRPGLQVNTSFLESSGVEDKESDGLPRYLSS